MAAAKAYVLVETAVGRARGMAEALRGMPGHRGMSLQSRMTLLSCSKRGA